MLITPSAMAPAAVEPTDLCELDLTTGLVSAGTPSSEWLLHLGVYRAGDAGAVVHTHSLAATAVSLIADELPAVHYYINRLGGPVPVVPYATYGSAELADAVGSGLRGRHAVIMANHGAVTTGPDAGRRPSSGPDSSSGSPSSTSRRPPSRCPERSAPPTSTPSAPSRRASPSGGTGLADRPPPRRRLHRCARPRRARRSGRRDADDRTRRARRRDHDVGRRHRRRRRRGPRPPRRGDVDDRRDRRRRRRASCCAR